MYLKLGPEPLRPESALLQKFMTFFLNKLTDTWGVSDTWDVADFWGDGEDSAQLSDSGFS